MKRREHYQEGGPSVDFYDLREAGGPGTLLEGDVEFYLAQAPMNRHRSAVHDPASGRDVIVEVLDRQTDPLTQTFSEIWRWTVSGNGAEPEVVEDVLRLRWTYRYEMRYLLELTGFRVVAEHSDFKRSAPRYGAEQVWVAEAD